MVLGICRLCKLEANLQCSHVMPSFAYRWLRKSSGDSHLRTTIKPNQRIQDGPKEYLLCEKCEARFSHDERDFASKLFHPYQTSSNEKYPYGPWLLRFCVSLSWRLLVYHIEKGVLPEFNQELLSCIEQAEAKWRKYLLGQYSHPGLFRQHLLPLDRITSASFNVPSNINRYILSTIDAELCYGSDTIITYSKVGRFLILGIVLEPKPNRWKGTKVNANRGIIEPKENVLTKQIFNYLQGRSRQLDEATSKISERQRAKIDKSFRTNIDKIVASDFILAMDADVENFGTKAVAIDPSGEKG